MNQLVAVAGGIIAVYAIFALITSHISEWISNAFNKRGTTLFTGIEVLLAATKQPELAAAAFPAAGKTLADYLYAHPLIGNLGTKDKPSYIPARTFTLSLVGALREFTALKGAGGEPILPALSATGPQLLDDLNARIQSLDVDDPLRRSLTLVIEGAAADYHAVLDGIDAWYLSQMDRISGNYKRWTSYWQIGIALVVVVLFNVDTIALVRGFLQNTALADAVAQVARGVDPNNAGSGDLLKALAQAGIPLGWDAANFRGVSWDSKSAGIAISWFAVMLGAPFWFDLLKRIVPVRLSGTKPAAGRDDASGDAQARDASVAASSR